jgi:hypothetical protein
MAQIFENFLNSWYGVAVLLGGVLIVFTHRSLGKFIEKLTLRFQRENLMVATEHSVEQLDVEDTGEFKKIQASMSELHISADREFGDFLDSVKRHLMSYPLTKREVRGLIHTIFTIKEQYEFAYLNLFLVANTKRAMLLLFERETVTKELFLSLIPLPEEIEDRQNQKEIIFNVLLCHHLISFEHGLCKVSDKGERFLEFIELV